LKTWNREENQKAKIKNQKWRNKQTSANGYSVLERGS